MKQKKYIAGLYFRLSQDDENIGETIKQQVRKYIAIKALKYNVVTKRDCN